MRRCLSFIFWLLDPISTLGLSPRYARREGHSQSPPRSPVRQEHHRVGITAGLLRQVRSPLSSPPARSPNTTAAGPARGRSTSTSGGHSRHLKSSLVERMLAHSPLRSSPRLRSSPPPSAPDVRHQSPGDLIRQATASPSALRVARCSCRVALFLPRCTKKSAVFKTIEKRYKII